MARPALGRDTALVVVSGRFPLLKRIKAEFGRLIRAYKLDGTVSLDIGFPARAPIAGVDE